MNDDDNQKQHERLSDKILRALELAIQQEDVAIAEILRQALEMSMTRRAGGQHFVEKREYPEEIENCMEILNAMRNENGESGY